MYVYIYIYIISPPWINKPLPLIKSRPGRKLINSNKNKTTQKTRWRLYTYIHIYVLTYILFTPSPPTKSLDFRGFDSSKLLILRGGNSHVRIIL